VVQLKDNTQGWIAARVEEVELRRNIDPKIPGSPQRYKLYNVHTHETYNVASKNFKSELRLEPVDEDDNFGETNGEATVTAEESVAAITDEPVLTLIDKDRAFSGSGTIETGTPFVISIYFVFYCKSVYTHLSIIHYFPFGQMC